MFVIWNYGSMKARKWPEELKMVLRKEQKT